VNLLEHKKINITEMNDMRAMLNAYESYELDGMIPSVLLYQSGYLTISGYEDETGIYRLDFPNEEVRASFAELQMDYCR
jgi:hypothetical protein